MARSTKNIHCPKCGTELTVHPGGGGSCPACTTEYSKQKLLEADVA